MRQSIASFTRFSQSIDAYDLPKRFTFPFYYQPHPLCLLAAKQLQQYLSQEQFKFTKAGKMFGVLLVRTPDGEVGFLSAYSGKMESDCNLEKFVPPVFDAFANESFVVKEMAIIGQINEEVSLLKCNPVLPELQESLANLLKEYEQVLEHHYQVMADNRKDRKARRAQIEQEKTDDAIEVLAQLSKQSIADKKQLKALKSSWESAILEKETALKKLNEEIQALAKTRRKLSAKLQRKLFSKYQFLNAQGDVQDLNSIFNTHDIAMPPSGAGECAAPKLLQFAYLHNFEPLAMAEFWWGDSPKSEVRKHLNFYPSCQSKCFPILGHMLKGLAVEDNPLLENPAQGRELPIIYQDQHILVVNKPHDFLSVPGTHIKDSVFTRLKEQFPEATGPLIVHRLDMATSGLMLIALTPRANKSLAKQFAIRQISKQYVALVEGEVEQKNGAIELPMRGDLDDRPRQLVCYQHGKVAETTWTFVETKNGHSKILLSPKTGRTHQLRVHCAHSLGLNRPIVGDTLYGNKADRLYLHARSITFKHPISGQSMTFTQSENW